MRKRELQEKLAALVAEERSQLERLQKEGKAMLGDEQESYEKRAKEIETVESQIQGLEAVELRMKQNAEREAKLAEFRSNPERPVPAKPGDPSDPQAELRSRAFKRALLGGTRVLTEQEYRALSVGDDTKGGYLQAPQQFVNMLLKGVDNAVFIRNLATKFQVNGAESLGVPKLTADPDDADWTSELATGNEDSAMAFGKRELRPHPLAKRIKVSNKLLRSSVMDVEGLVNNRLGYKFGISQEKGFMTGTGAQQPLGVFIASADGIPTTRDVSTGNTTTTIGADGLIEAKHAIKGQYWPNLRWIFHRDAVKQIRKLKDGNGQYIWQPGLSADIPPRILEVTYIMSEYAPNTFTTGSYVGIIGDFQFYWIADSISMQIQVLNELYAETNHTGYIGRMEVDGAPVLEEAFARVKLA